jgi:hypothetical protein
MARFAFLLFSLFLFALNPASANWHTNGAQISSHKGLSSRTRWCPLRKLRESEKLQSAVGSSYERMRLRGLKRCDQHFIAPQ